MIKCEVCGAELKRDKNQQRRNKHNFCSRKCYEVWWKKNVLGSGEKNHKWKPKTEIKCACCGKKFNVSAYMANTAKFCSRSCSAKYYFTGSNNPQWKGGVTEFNDKFRKSEEYKQWRADVYKRDNWTCQECGYKGRQLVAHHIKKFADYPELRLELSNGITLCRKCHASIENPQRSYVGLASARRYDPISMAT